MTNLTGRPAVKDSGARTIASNGASRREMLARAALEEVFGRPFSEEEWCLHRSRLLAYARLLQEWNTAK